MERPGLRYETIGRGYAQRRREDPNLKSEIEAALAGAGTIVNVGAGGGSYEPAGSRVIAVEPSDVMVSQRPAGLGPAVRGLAQALPLATDSVEGAMAVLTLHHWHPDQQQGIREMRRVARGPIVVVSIDPVISNRMWLMADYLHEVAELDLQIFPAPAMIASWLGDKAEIRTLPIHRDTPDETLMSFWAHPERVLDEQARNATSGFARQSPEVVQRVVTAVKRDLESGAWEAKHGHLRALDAFDAGLRLIVG